MSSVAQVSDVAHEPFVFYAIGHAYFVSIMFYEVMKGLKLSCNVITDKDN